MPTYLMQLRWTDWGYANIKTAQRRRGLARVAAQANNVTIRVIHETLQGPNFIVAGQLSDVNNLKAVFDGQANVSVTTTVYPIGPEPDH
jgi:L-asparaginase II